MAGIQFKRIFNFTGNFDTAVNNIKTKLSPSLQPGEPLICSYDDGKKFLLAIGIGNGDVKIIPTYTNRSEMEDAISSPEKIQAIIKDELEKKANKFTVGEGLIYSEDKIDIAVSKSEGNEIEIKDDGLYCSSLIKSVDISAHNGINLTLDSGKLSVNVNLDAIASAIGSKTVKSDDVKLTYNIGTDVNPDRYTTEKSVHNVLEDLNKRVEEIKADLDVTLEGGVVKVIAGDGVSIDSTDASKPVVSVKISSGSAIKVTDEGLDLQWEILN